MVETQNTVTTADRGQLDDFFDWLLNELLDKGYIDIHEKKINKRR